MTCEKAAKGCADSWMVGKESEYVYLWDFWAVALICLLMGESFSGQSVQSVTGWSVGRSDNWSGWWEVDGYLHGLENGSFFGYNIKHNLQIISSSIVNLQTFNLGIIRGFLHGWCGMSEMVRNAVA